VVRCAALSICMCFLLFGVQCGAVLAAVMMERKTKDMSSLCRCTSCLVACCSSCSRVLCILQLKQEEVMSCRSGV
jgi:hypothetical protein